MSPSPACVRSPTQRASLVWRLRFSGAGNLRCRGHGINGATLSIAAPARYRHSTGSVGLFPECVLQGEPAGQSPSLTSDQTSPYYCYQQLLPCLWFLSHWLTITVTCLWLFPKIQGLTDNIFKIYFPLNTQRRWRTIPNSLIIPLWFHLGRFLAFS